MTVVAMKGVALWLPPFCVVRRAWRAVSVRTPDNREAKADREVTRGVEVPPETLVVGTPSRKQPQGMDAAGRQL